MSKVIFKQQIIDAMMGFKSLFEKVLYSDNYRLYWSGKEKLPSFTISDASLKPMQNIKSFMVLKAM